MTLSRDDVYQDVITKLVACLNKTDRKKIKSIIIRYTDRDIGARPEPPDHYAEQIEFFPREESKMILTSVKITTEVFKP